MRETLPERRSVLAVSMALMVSMGMLFALTGGATASATFTAGDVSVTTDNGQMNTTHADSRGSD